MAELKPCPFCGGKRSEVINLLKSDPQLELAGVTEENWKVLCIDCFGCGGVRRTADEAIEAWNRREEDERS